MLENVYKQGLCKRVMARYPDAIVLHLDPNEIQGIPDLLILFPNGRWAALEGKKEMTSKRRPNQDYYVDLMNRMSFAAYICPENEEEVLNAMEQSL